MLIAAELRVAAWPLFAATEGGLATLGLLAGAAGWLVESSTERARMVLPLLSRRSEVRSRSSYCCSAATWEPSSFVVWLATGPILTTLALAIPANLMHEAANDGGLDRPGHRRVGWGSSPDIGTRGRLSPQSQAAGLR